MAMSMSAMEERMSLYFDNYRPNVSYSHHTYFALFTQGNIRSCNFVCTCMYVKCLVQNTHCVCIIS